MPLFFVLLGAQLNRRLSSGVAAALVAAACLTLLPATIGTLLLEGRRSVAAPAAGASSASPGQPHIK